MKILYGVPGEGMGHATRSKRIISHLLKNHDVQVVSSGRAYRFLRDEFGDHVSEIRGFHLSYSKGGVSRWGTIASTIKGAPKDLAVNLKRFLSVNRHFRADVVISDFESFTLVYAKLHRIPVISIDNMQIMDRCSLEFPVPSREKKNALIAKGIVRAKVPRAAHYLITAFFKTPTAKKNTTLVPPILREEILRARRKAGKHILVYQTSTSQNDLVSCLRSVSKESFRVYGFNRDEAHGNVKLKSFSEKGFVRDLASCKAVITNGGFSLISEAVFLHKPICSVPLANQFEQFVNAAYLEKLGYGKRLESFSADGLKSFLYDLESFQKAVSTYRQNGNKKLLHTLDRVLAEALKLK